MIAQIKEQMQSNSEPSLIAYNDYICLEPQETVCVNNSVTSTPCHLNYALFENLPLALSL